MALSAGIDFGNMNCVIAVPSVNGVDVVLNQSSNRLTPTMVTFTGDRRYAGEISQQQQMQHFRGTITELKRLIMLEYESKEREIIESYVPFKLVRMEDNTTGVEVVIKNSQTISIRPEMCIALLLKELAKIAMNHCDTIDRYVFAVSPWWTEKQRRAFFCATKIAGIDNASLVNSTTAAAVAYSMIHSDRLPPYVDDTSPIPIAFIDFGNSSMNVSIINICQRYVDVKSFTDDNNLGGFHFSIRLQKYLLEKVMKMYHINPQENPRAMLRFNQAVEKCKKTLSINPIVQFEVPSLMNGVDVNFAVHREEFERQITDLIDRIEAPIEEALKLANTPSQNLFEIQVLGGTSRIVAVRKKLTEIFGREPMKSLNLDECFAIGSGYMAAILSPNMVVNAVVKDVLSHEITAIWDDKKELIFPQFSYVGAEKVISINVKGGNKDVQIWNKDEQIGIIKVDTCAEKEAKVKIRIRLTQSGTVEIVEGLFKSHMGKTREAKIESCFVGDLSEEKLSEYLQLENELTIIDEKENQIDHIKNEFESHLFTIENDMNRDLKEFIEPSQREEMNALVSNVHCWHEENEFDRLSLDEYQEKLSLLKQAFDPIFKTRRETKALLDKAEPIRNRLEDALDKLEKSVCHELNAGYAMLHDSLCKYVKSMRNFFNQPKYVHLNVDLDKEEEKTDILINEVEKMIRSPVIPVVNEEILSVDR